MRMMQPEVTGESRSPDYVRTELRDGVAVAECGVPVLLVHGGCVTARLWDRSAPLVGGPTLAVKLPGRADRPAGLSTLSVEDETASVVTDIEAEVPDGSVLLVAHSSGGLAGTAARPIA